MATMQGTEGQTGKQLGSNLTVSLGEYAEILETPLMAAYYQQTYRGNKFSNLYASAALAAASTSAQFVLINPPSSKVNLVLVDAYVAITAMTAVATGTNIVLGWFAANPLPGTIGTQQTPINTLVGNSAKSSAIAAPTATTGLSPVYARTLASLYGDLAASNIPGIRDDIRGAIIIPPGNGVAIFGVNGTPADITIAPSLTWDEIPV